MDVNRGEQDTDTTGVEEDAQRRGALRLITRTLAGAWEHNIFSEAAGAAFWQTLSLPPLLLGLLGSLGFIADWFGPNIVNAVQQKLISFAGTVFAPSVVEQIISPTVSDILTKGHSEIVSLGFIISWWAGSSALASLVDSITVAYGQYGVRHPVWQRIVSLLMYLVALVCAIVGLPVLALGPGLLPALFPLALQPTVSSLVGIFYYPATAGLLVIVLTTLYKAAVPKKLPWWRGLAGAALAMVVALLSSIGLRFYLRIVLSTGYTYGALATPIAFLLGAFLIGLAVIIGAHFNSAIEEMWPAKMSRGERRRWRRLELEHAAERMNTHRGQDAWRRKDEDPPPAERTAEPAVDDEHQPTDIANHSTVTEKSADADRSAASSVTDQSTSDTASSGSADTAGAAATGEPARSDGPAGAPGAGAPPRVQPAGANGTPDVPRSDRGAPALRRHRNTAD